MTSRQSVRALLALGALLGLGCSSSGFALNIHYDLQRDSELRACDQHRYVGDEDAADNCFRVLLSSGSTLVQAQAAMALNDVANANKLFREAASDDRDPAINTAWGYLYLHTHQVSDATALFREALVFEPGYLPAELGLARALSRTFEGQARAELQRLHLAHPDNVHVLVLLASIELELKNTARARELLDSAGSLAAAQGIPPLEIYALQAGANLLEAESIEPWVDKALDYNPRYGDIFSIAARYYIITYRYREAVDLYQRAVDTNPNLAVAHRDLGINLLRINRVYDSRHHLETAIELDPFDAETVNTLRLLDKLDSMQVSRIDVPDPEDPNQSLARVLIRLDREESEALYPYVVDLSLRAVQTLTDRYGFRLEKPMVVELYHDHDDFGVRTVSTPGIGLLGVTFGYVTAMDSPKARPPGEFHWGTTLWHEIVHVFTLEASNHLLPRWMSEGLSVYEEWNTGPLSTREISLGTLNAIKTGQLLPIAQLDEGFVRPSYDGQVQVSYTQAGLVCDFIAMRWGHEALRTMLRAFRIGADTATALRIAIGDDSDDFDIVFNEHLTARYGELVQSLDEYRIANRQLGAAVAVEDWISVEALARDLIRRYPERVGPANPYEVLARAQREQDDEAGAMDTLWSWYQLGGHTPETMQVLATHLFEQDRDDDAAKVLESLNWVMPYAVDEHRQLGQYYLANDDPERAIREFNAYLGVSGDNPAEGYYGQAQAALQLDKPEEAKQLVLQALESAPFFRPAQHFLLELTSGAPLD
ncbi:MAG: tetratricopeptide repeat protein [Granulosicoccus sp.]|nr:tetratricopeptide repeat protein [Granulosicoccus sp.]